MRPFLERFSRDCLIVKDVLAILRKNGLHDESDAKVLQLLDILPNRPMRAKLQDWLEETRKVQQKLALPLQGIRA